MLRVAHFATDCYTGVPPKSHGGLVLTPVVLILLLVFLAAVFDFIIIFFLPGVAQIRIFMEKYVRPYFTLIPVRNTGKTY